MSMLAIKKTQFRLSGRVIVVSTETIIVKFIAKYAYACILKEFVYIKPYHDSYFGPTPNVRFLSIYISS